MHLDLDIRSNLAAWELGLIELEAFEDWFIGATWDISKSGNEAAIMLTKEIDLRLAEHTNGHWTEQELKLKLAPFANVYFTQQMTISGSSIVATVEGKEVSYLGDRAPAWVSVSLHPLPGERQTSKDLLPQT